MKLKENIIKTQVPPKNAKNSRLQAGGRDFSAELVRKAMEMRRERISF
jgi:hypothetical protein